MFVNVQAHVFVCLCHGRVFVDADACVSAAAAVVEAALT